MGRAHARRTSANVKAFRLFTGHATSPSVLPPDLRAELPKTEANFYFKDVPRDLREQIWQRFKAALAPLRDAGKLGMVHFQFAPVDSAQSRWPCARGALRRRDEGLHGQRRIPEQDLVRRRPSRGDIGIRARTRGRAHGIDGPHGVHNSVPPVWESTHVQYSLVRLHGRNHETWNIKGAKSAAERFNYDYPEHELTDIATRVERLAPETFTTHVVMNNNYEDQGQRNAATLVRILDERHRARVPKLVRPEQPADDATPETTRELVAAGEWIA